MFNRRTRRRLHRLFSYSLIAVLLNLTFPTPTHAATRLKENSPIVHTTTVTTNEKNWPDGLPSIKDKPRPVTKKRLVVRASAYSSTPDQTDGDPFTTASGSKVHDGTIAVNGLPFGTKVRIPDYFGDKIFVVEDRMAARWGNQKIDIWMTTREQAKQWGVRTITIEII